MNGPVLSGRFERGGGAARSVTIVTRGAADADADLTPEQKAQIAAQHAAFDFETAERAELMREETVLQDMMMQELKNEDEIVKKWIALI